jgi:hypothetical protein
MPLLGIDEDADRLEVDREDPRRCGHQTYLPITFRSARIAGQAGTITASPRTRHDADAQAHQSQRADADRSRR